MNRKKWIVNKCDKDLAATIAENCGVDPFVAYLLVARGFTDEFLVESFLYDTDICDPFTLPDMEKACERIKSAIDEGEKILKSIVKEDILEIKEREEKQD